VSKFWAFHPPVNVWGGSVKYLSEVFKFRLGSNHLYILVGANTASSKNKSTIKKTKDGCPKC